MTVVPTTVTHGGIKSLYRRTNREKPTDVISRIENPTDVISRIWKNLMEKADPPPAAAEKNSKIIPRNRIGTYLRGIIMFYFKKILFFLRCIAFNPKRHAERKKNRRRRKLRASWTNLERKRPVLSKD